MSAAARGVLLDLDETLLVEYDSNEAAYRATCEFAAVEAGLDAARLFDALRRHRRGLWRRSPTFAWCLSIGISSTEAMWAPFEGEDLHLAALRAWAPAFRQEAWRRALAEQGPGHGDLVERLVERFQVERRARQVVYPEVPGVLEVLRATHRLALVTDGDPGLQREKVEASGLGAYLDAVVVSGEVGAGKPDRRMFEAALERLGVRAEAAVMVGDNPHRDVSGAQAAGIGGVWINRPGLDPPEDVRPDWVIRGLDELPAILAAAAQTRPAAP